MRSSLKNMCSVRTRPMPTAPNSRALLASAGVSALARTAVVARSCAQPRIFRNSSDSLGSTSGRAPTITSPVAPFSVITWPSRTTARPARKRCRSSSTTTSPAPTTQHLPQPRATTAACEVSPPRDVRTPWAACMPATSSGDVSARTRIAGSSRSAISTAFSGSKTTLPTAAAGVAGKPRAIDVYSAVGIDRLHEELVQRLRLDAQQRGLPRLVGRARGAVAPCRRRALARHLHGDAHGRGRRPLAGARLQDVEPALLHRELDVLHVAVVALERVLEADECACRPSACAASARRAARACGRPPRRPRPGR